MRKKCTTMEVTATDAPAKAASRNTTACADSMNQRRESGLRSASGSVSAKAGWEQSVLCTGGAPAIAHQEIGERGLEEIQRLPTLPSPPVQYLSAPSDRASPSPASANSPLRDSTPARASTGWGGRFPRVPLQGLHVGGPLGVVTTSLSPFFSPVTAVTATTPVCPSRPCSSSSTTRGGPFRRRSC